MSVLVGVALCQGCTPTNDRDKKKERQRNSRFLVQNVEGKSRFYSYIQPVNTTKRLKLKVTFSSLHFSIDLTRPSAIASSPASPAQSAAVRKYVQTVYSLLTHAHLPLTPAQVLSPREKAAGLSLSPSSLPAHTPPGSSSQTPSSSIQKSYR